MAENLDTSRRQAARDPYGTGIKAPPPVRGPQYGPDQTLDLNDLGNPNLSLTDQQYLAGLGEYYNPGNAAAKANAGAWNEAMSRVGSGAPPPTPPPAGNGVGPTTPPPPRPVLDSQAPYTGAGAGNPASIAGDPAQMARFNTLQSRAATARSGLQSLLDRANARRAAGGGAYSLGTSGMTGGLARLLQPAPARTLPAVAPQP